MPGVFRLYLEPLRPEPRGSGRWEGNAKPQVPTVTHGVTGHHQSKVWQRIESLRLDKQHRLL